MTMKEKQNKKDESSSCGIKQNTQPANQKRRRCEWINEKERETNWINEWMKNLNR